MTFQYHDTIEVEIETLTNLGAGLGRIEGMVVMVPFALPGEKVCARIYKVHKNYLEADCIEILRPSSQRIQPQCQLFGTCGGCQYQNLAYDEQLRWKTFHVKEQMERALGTNVDVLPAVPSPQIYGYRSKITPHYQNTKIPNFPIGFLKSGCRHALVDVPHCPIASDAINRALPKLREDTHKRTHKRGGTLLMRDIDGSVETREDATVSVQLLGKRLHFIAGEFFQNNPFLLETFATYVIEQAQNNPHLVDAYCGCGFFGILGSAYFERVIGVEINEAAINLAQKNACVNNIDNIQFKCGSAESLFDDLKVPNQETSVILDPPRRGCDATFLNLLMKFGPQKIVYVSCAPDTQARDLVALTTTYTIESVQPFDMFPQTRHIENVVTLRRR